MVSAVRFIASDHSFALLLHVEMMSTSLPAEGGKLGHCCSGGCDGGLGTIFRRGRDHGLLIALFATLITAS